MTSVGHTLTGAALGTICLPEDASPRRKSLHLAVFMLLANLPDFPLPHWGHNRYYFSHSLFVNLTLIGLLAAGLALLPWLRRTTGGWRVIALGAAAWLSHLLLDSFYNHGKGIAIFWPFSDARLALPLPWFSVMKHAQFPPTPEMLRIAAIEFACYFPLILLAIWVRKMVNGIARSRAV